MNLSGDVEQFIKQPTQLQKTSFFESPLSSLFNRIINKIKSNPKSKTTDGQMNKKVYQLPHPLCSPLELMCIFQVKIKLSHSSKEQQIS